MNRLREEETMERITRVSITFPPALLKDFDEVVKTMGYHNRSKAVQDAVHEFITEHRLLREEKGHCVGVITILYDHEVKGLEAQLTDIQHCFSQIISSAMHMHLTSRDCLETIMVKDSADQIRNLSDKLKTCKGVKLLKLILIKP